VPTSYCFVKPRPDSIARRCRFARSCDRRCRDAPDGFPRKALYVQQHHPAKSGADISYTKIARSARTKRAFIEVLAPSAMTALEKA
jgi:hypothetical protein